MISVYQFKMGTNPFQTLLARFFPGQGGWVTTFRYGFARIAGPYGHAILAGVIFAVAYRMQRWLQWNECWRGHLKWLPMDAGSFVTYAIIGGSVMTLCRGPWIGAFCGMVASLIGRAIDRRRALTITLVLLITIGTPGYLKFKAYVSVGRAGAKTVAQESAAYRKELLDKYIAIAEQRAAFGWGLTGWPKLPGMPSIDNYYLLISLMHGVTALGLLLAIFIWLIVRLGRYGAARPSSSPSGSLAFSLLGAYLAVMVSIATVYLGIGEADHNHASSSFERAQAVGETIAADRVQHDIDATAVSSSACSRQGPSERTTSSAPASRATRSFSSLETTAIVDAPSAWPPEGRRYRHRPRRRARARSHPPASGRAASTRNRRCDS